MTSDLINILDMGSERVVADLAVKTIEENPGSLREMLDLCFLEKYPLSMRASRVMQLYFDIHRSDIYPYLEELIEKTLLAKISGVRRNFLKVFAEFTDISRISDPGPLLNTCFEWLLDASLPPGIRVHAMTIIYKLGENEPALLHELAATIEIIMDESEISMKTCGRKMLKRIAGQLDNN
jgi:hypothetical protein